MPGSRSLIRWWGAIPVALVISLLAVRACVHVDPRDRLRPTATEAGDPPGTRAGTGALAITRGGPVVIGFQSPGPARLSIVGQELRGDGLVKARYVISQSVVALRFAGPPGARLVWSPVGRRGDPEYIPSSSLSPDDPTTATFDAPGTARLDGVISLGLLLVVIGTVLMLARRRLARVSRATWIATAGVFGIAVVVRWLDLGGFGQTWDEDVNWAAGRNYVTNLLALDFSNAAWTWNYEHPPVMKLLAGVGAQFTDGFGPARALSAVWISLGCALLVPIGARLISFRVGVLAAGIAALMPTLVAHGQIVGHESPTVLWWSLGILLALGVHDGLDGLDPARARRTLWIRLAVVGVVVGIAIASRFVNGLLGPLCVVIVLIQAPASWRRATVIGTAWMVVGTIVTFYVVWPRLWTDPIGALSTSLARLSTPHAPEPFLGVVTNRPPVYYFVAYLVATLPLGLLVGVVLGAVRGARERTRRWWIILAWLVIPLVVAASPVRQDGVRYVMPCLTALALLSAAGFDAAASWVVRRTRDHEPGRRTHVALGAAIALYLGVTLARVHPYYLDYFGEHVGGAGHVAKRQWFETAWWGEGVKAAVDHVNAHAEPRARVYRDCIEPVHLAWFREDLWTTMATAPALATWIVVYAPDRRRCAVPPDAREVFTVEVDGVTLAAVYRRQ